MKKHIKGVWLAACLLVIVGMGANIATGGDITANGFRQGDIYTFLSNVVTAWNEGKGDHNTLFGDYSGCKQLVNELKTDHNLGFADYSGTVVWAIESRADHNTLFADYSGAIIALNALKADHNTLLGSYSAVRKEVDTLRTRYNSVFVKMSTLNYQAYRSGGFATVTGTQAQVLGANLRDTNTTNADILTAARTIEADGAKTSSRIASAAPGKTTSRTAAANGALTGSRTSTGDLSLTGL